MHAHLMDHLFILHPRVLSFANANDPAAAITMDGATTDSRAGRRNRDHRDRRSRAINMNNRQNDHVHSCYLDVPVLKKTFYQLDPPVC